MAVGKHPIAYREPRGGKAPPAPPLQCVAIGHLRHLQKVHRVGCCDSQMLEEWLLEGMQLESQLRIGKWIAQILWFHPILDAYAGDVCIYSGNAVGDSSDARQFNWATR